VSRKLTLMITSPAAREIRLGQSVGRIVIRRFSCRDGGLRLRLNPPYEPMPMRHTI